MEEARLELCRIWAETTDRHPHIAGLRLPEGMATEMVEEIDRLYGRLEAVCDVVNNAVAFGDSPESGRIMEAVRGESDGALRIGDRVRMNRDIAGMKEGEEAVVVAVDIQGTNLVQMSMVDYAGNYNMDPEYLDKVRK